VAWEDASVAHDVHALLTQQEAAVATFRLEGSNAVSETLMIPLWARALEQQQPEPLVRDPLAAEIVGRIDYDWHRIKVNRHDLAASVVRVREFDRCTRKFLANYPTATVVHIGCGLDTRFQRVDNGQVRWFDLDLPDVIAPRKQLLPESERNRYLSGSVFEPSWMDVVDAPGAGPFLFLSEAVLTYFEESQVKGLIVALQRRFTGAELVTDGVTPLTVTLDNLHLAYTGSAARIRWGLKDPHDVEGWSPGIRLLESFYLFERPEPRLGLLNWWRHVPAISRGSGVHRYRLS
jgi:O-methyltransferase involved in polyketide biosynthesis